jgi:hypothetical protein
VALTAGAKNLRAVQAGWGDALADVGPLNPHFKEEELAGYRWGWGWRALPPPGLAPAVA